MSAHDGEPTPCQHTTSFDAIKLLNTIGDACYVLDYEWRFIFVNDSAERLVRRTRAELIGRSVWDEFPEAVGSTFEVNYRRAVQQQLTMSFEAFYPPLNVWLEVRAYPSETGLSVFYQDVTQRKEALQALERSRRDLQLAVDGARLGTFYCDWPLDKIIWNRTCKEHFFLPPDADVDIHLFYSLLHPDDREPTRFAIERAQNERIGYDVEYRTLASDGRTRWINAVGHFYYAEDGSPTRFDGITIDISARKAAEEALERRVEREALLNRIGQALRASIDAEEVLTIAMREVGEALGADRTYYAAYDLTADSARVVAEWHLAGLPGITGQFKMSDFRANRDPHYKAGRTQVINDAIGDSGLLAMGITSLVRVPLVSTGAMTAMSAAMSSGPRFWTEPEVTLLESVATFTQSALQSVRVRERERRIAQQLQDALQPELPRLIPSLSLGHQSRPALDEVQVGGDFYDVFPLNDQQFAIVIGDVSGKGLAAAQQLALIRNTLRAMLYRLKAPAKAAVAVNEVVTAHNLLVGFVTCWVGVYDVTIGEIRYCCCGHEPSLIRRANGHIDILSTTGPPLGIDFHSAFADANVILKPGDTLLLYTDGLSEAGPNRRNILGTDGLVSIFSGAPQDLSLQALAEHLIEEVSNFSGVFHDDVAVLLCRREFEPVAQ